METIIFKTLMHSVWQGLILAVLTTMVIIFTKHSSSALRYKWLTACLLLFTIGTIVTLVVSITEVNDQKAKALEIVNSNVVQNNAIRYDHAQAVAARPVYDNFISTLNYLNQHAAYIVWFWMLIIFAKSIEMALGLRKVSYIKRNEVYDAGSNWEVRLKALCIKFRIHKKVRIMQSGIAKAPLVVGHFKPLILIPLGLMNNLTIAEVEAIISHELAHIRRKDYLVNLLQSFLDIIFFFNPAVLWLNKLIREERENCCDDLSLNADVRLRDYISALVTCTELAQGKDKFALGFASQKSQLMNRVNRMVYKKNTSVNTVQKIILVALLFSIQLLTAAVSMPAAINSKQVKQQPAGKKNKPAAVNSGTSKIKNKTTTKKTETYTRKSLTVVNGKQVENDKKDVISQQKAIADAKRAVNDQKQAADVVVKDASDMKIAAQIEVQKLDRLVQADKARLAYLNKKTEIPPLPELSEANPQKLPDPRPLDDQKKTYGKTGDQYKKTGEQYKVDPQHPDKMDRRFREEDGERLHNELYAEGIMKDKKNTSYILNSKELRVDGVRQPESLRKKYADKYLYRPDMSILYNYDYNSSTYKQ